MIVSSNEGAMASSTPMKKIVAGTFREPQPPEKELAERVRRGQSELRQFTERTRKTEMLTQEDYEVRINARD
jgi:hypothetical protein